MSTWRLRSRTHEAAVRIVEIAEEHSTVRSRQAVTKRAHSSPSASGSSLKKAQREPEAKAPLQGISQPELDPAKFEKEKEVPPSLIQSYRGRGPATSEGTDVTKRPQLEAMLAPLMTSGEGVEMQQGSPSVMIPTLKVVESSPTTRPISGKALIVEASLVQVSSPSFEGGDHDTGT